MRFSRLEYANSFEAGDRLAGWSRADSNIGPDSVTNAVYLYAASGCTTNVLERCADGTERRVSYTWTDDYRLASVSVNGAAVAEYAYDVLGNLVGVATTDESFEILVDGGHSLADVASDGTPLRVYLRGPGVDSWLGFVDMTGATPVPYYYVTDHLGSVLAVTDASGNLVERYEYDAWGKVLSVTDANCQQLSRSAIGNRILWQGREYSWTTGLYYFRNRWYDPVVGRWISKDPIGIQGGVNLYEFCEGSPVVYTDAFGLTTVWDTKPFPGSKPKGSGDAIRHERWMDDGRNEVCKLDRISAESLDQEMRTIADKLHGFELKDKKRSIWHEAFLDTKFCQYPRERRFYSYVEGHDDVWADNEINYIGIGMYEAWLNHSIEWAETITALWKLQYSKPPSVGTYYWLHYGYNQFRSYYEEK